MAELKKSLGFYSFLLITITSIMGTGIFFLPAVAAAVMGPASIVAWIILSVFAIYISTLFAELCSMFPSAGGIYEFAKQTYPRPIAFFVGWATLVAANITIAMLIIGAIQYLLPFDVSYAKEIVSAIFILIFNYISFKGIKLSSTMLITFSFIILGTLASLIIPNLVKFDPANLTPFSIASPTLLLFGIVLIAETFFGWESPLSLSGETKYAARVVPRSLVVGTVAITLISLVFVISSLGAMDWRVFSSSPAPLLSLAENGYGLSFSSVFIILVYVSIIGSVAAWIISSPRLILSLAKDKFLPKRFADIHPKNGTPHKAILFQTVVSIILVFVGSANYRMLLEMLLPMLLSLYSVVIFAVFYLRITKPEVKRLFNAPFPRLGPILVITVFGVLFYTWFQNSSHAMHSIQLAAAFMLSGVPVYFLLKLRYDPVFVNRLNNIFTYSMLFFEDLIVPWSVRRKVVHLLGNLRGKRVFEFGCGVGTLTHLLAKEVGKKGKVYATDISKRSIDLARNRIHKQGHSHVDIFHDLMHSVRVHPNIPKVDKIVAVSVLDRVEKLDNILTDMNKKLDHDDRICFVEFDNFFGIFSNIDWLSRDEMITNLFYRNGFKVSIDRERTFFWKTIYIYGKKFKEVRSSEEKIDLDDVHTSIEEIKGFPDMIKRNIESYRKLIFRKDIAFVFLYDLTLKDYDFRFNRVYMDRIIGIMLEIIFSSCMKNGRVILWMRKGDDLEFRLLVETEEDLLEGYVASDDSRFAEDEHVLKQNVKDISYLKRLVALAYKGDVLIQRLSEDVTPQDRSDLEEIVIGYYESGIIRSEEPFLEIIIRLPFHQVS